VVGAERIERNKEDVRGAGHGLSEGNTREEGKGRREQQTSGSHLASD